MPTKCLDSADPKLTRENGNIIHKDGLENRSYVGDIDGNDEVITQEKSPSSSLCSQIISITTLDDDDQSSVADSDLEFDEGDNYVHRKEVKTIQTFSEGNGITLINSQSVDDDRCDVSSASSSAMRPNIGSIAVQNSSDITFGNKTFYQGPVTIKQFMYENQKWRPTEQTNDNPAFNSDGSNLGNPDGYLPHDKTETKSWYSMKRPILLTLLLSIIAILVASFTLTTVFFRDDINEGTTSHKIGDGDDYRPNIPINSSIGNDILTDGSNSLRMVARDEWLAQPPENPLTDLELPATRVIIAHSATENCTNQAMCTFRTRIIQTYHMESRGWDDIGYNFLVGGDGNAYEGRGWDKQGAHTKGFNQKSICIAFIGTFNKLIPPKRQLLAAQQIIERGVKLGKLDPNYKLYGHRQLGPFESPGTALYEVIVKWPHWTSDL